MNRQKIVAPLANLYVGLKDGTWGFFPCASARSNFHFPTFCPASDASTALEGAIRHGERLCVKEGADVFVFAQIDDRWTCAWRSVPPEQVCSTELDASPLN